MSGPDPIFRDKGAWFFWDETWADAHGPFETEVQARQTLAFYAEHLNREAIVEHLGGAS